MLGISGRIVAGAAGKRNFELEALTHIARLSSPSRALETALNTLIAGLKSDGIWDNIYAICVQHNIQGESLYDLKGTQDSNNLAGATWTSSGWSLGNDTGVIDTQVVPTSSGGVIALNDNHLMVYMATTLTGDGMIMGGGANTSNQISMMYAILGLTPDTIGYYGDGILHAFTGRITIVDPSGFFVGSLLSGTSAMRVNGTEATIAETSNSSTPGANSLYVGDFNGAFPDLLNPSETFTAWASGAGLTATQRVDYYNHIQDYMVTMGWEA